MPNTFFGLTIGTSGLYASQASINTVAHNVSNVETEGYTRQKVNTSASEAVSLNNPYGMAGTGIDANGVEQIRNEYYDKKYRTNMSLNGNYELKEYYMKSIENYFSEVNSDGITAAFDTFFNSLSSLSTNTGSETIRTQVANYAQSFTEMVNNIANGLAAIQTEANYEIKTSAERINAIAQQVATLNKQINTVEITGRMANDLRDARNVLLDELSQYCKIETEEDPMGDSGIYTFSVRVDGKCLVEGYEYNTLIAVPQDMAVNMNDEAGLYTLEWSDGQSFDRYSNRLGGKLQALYELRDGNNQVNFTGTGNGTKGSRTLTVTDTSCDDLIWLNIPQMDGKITISGNEYSYKSFKVDVDDQGKYTYTFTLNEDLKRDITDKPINVGESIDYKGIPYYMARLNEFVRTVSREFNKIHDTGKDQYGKMEKLDFFTAAQATSGADYNFTEETKGFSFTSVCATKPDGNVVLNADGKVDGCYYYLTCKNYSVSQDIMSDPKKIAAGTGTTDKTGVEDNNTLKDLYALYTDNSLFKQGDPSDFLRTMISDIGIDTKKAASFADGQSNIVKAIDSQRKSISGVDKDEEAMDLMKFKNAYDLSSKVISVMNEVYNKLINETGV